MSAKSPMHSAREPELDENAKRTLNGRLKTFDEDVKQAVPAEQVISEGRAKLAKIKHPAPR